VASSSSRPTPALPPPGARAPPNPRPSASPLSPSRSPLAVPNLVSVCCCFCCGLV
jgi:hypothetical protein